MSGRQTVAGGFGVVGCTGKRQYETFNVAHYAARSMRRNKDDCLVSPYKCRNCHAFHVGESPDREGLKSLRAARMGGDAQSCATREHGQGTDAAREGEEG